jgi:hypothetical protein
MKKYKRTNKTLLSRTTPPMKENIQTSTSEPRMKPKTYQVMQIDSDDEFGVVRMTAREIFEQNCAGQELDSFDGMSPEQIRARMRAQASRKVLLEDVWHPEDVGTVAEACTDYILEFREMKKLDAQQMNNVRAPAEAVQRNHRRSPAGRQAGGTENSERKQGR